MAVPHHGSDRTRNVLRSVAPILAWLSIVVGGCAQDAVPQVAPEQGLDVASVADLSFESFGWHAVLRDETGEVHALRERFDRLSPDQPSQTGQDAAGSRWRFSSVMRVDGAIVHGSEPALAWQSVQRAAAGLAESRLASASSDERFGVLGHRVSREAPVDMPSRCAAQWQLELGSVARLDTSQQRCPTSETLGELTSSISDALPATLHWVEEGRSRSARGVAWLRHLQGPLPSPGSAVVFDYAVLTLGDVGTLELMRSRRRSGRGEPVVSGTLSLRGRRVALKEPHWTPTPSSSGGGRLEVASLGIDVELETLALPGTDVPSAMPAVADGPGSSVAIFASGTHRGAGFAEFATGESDS